MANVAVEGASKSALLEGDTQDKTPEAPLIVRVARAHNVSPLRQLRETLALRLGAQKLRPKDYYGFGLYDPAMPMAEKRQYLGVTGNTALNARLSPPDLIPTGAFVGNKVLYTALLTQMGLGTTQTQAIATVQGGFGTLPALRDAPALKAFLTEDAVYPIFGKPRHGSLSEGSVRIDRCVEGRLHLGDGTVHGVDAFCNEVFGKYPGGFLLQSALKPHADLVEVTGSAVGCVRLVTVNDMGAPRPLYALWKIPSPQAMSDNFWQEGSMLAALDVETGTVTACVKGTGLDRQDVSHHPVSEAAIIGRTLPFWSEIRSLASNAHALFPEFGVCGYDIAVCDDGPKIVECNDNPFHTLYQTAHGRGALNSDLATVWETVVQRQKQQLARLKAAGAQA